MKHHFTVDVEEHFQVSAMDPFVSRDDWDSIPSRVERSTAVLLDLLAEYNATGTFFVLGWIARRHASLVRGIAAAGHEVASHGWGHERITQLTPDQFRDSIRSSKKELEDLSGRPVLGYRAPSFSIVRGGEWALDLLMEEGYVYDSSLFPVQRSGYGFEGGERDPYAIRRGAGTLYEFPPATVKVGDKTLPAGGGAYFRILPYALMQAALKGAENRSCPATFYIHPWEVDPEQPRINVPVLTRIRHYGGLSRTTTRLRRMLKQFAFQSIETTLSQGVPATMVHSS